MEKAYPFGYTYKHPERGDWRDTPCEHHTRERVTRRRAAKSMMLWKLHYNDKGDKMGRAKKAWFCQFARWTLADA